MRAKVAGLCLAIAGLSLGCAGDKTVPPKAGSCNPGTLLLELSCKEGAESGQVRIALTRKGDGKSRTYDASLDCGRPLRLEVAVEDYASGNVFSLNVTGAGVQLFAGEREAPASCLFWSVDLARPGTMMPGDDASVTDGTEMPDARPAVVGTLAPGDACTQNAECQNNRCIDGFCCATECSGKCTACNVPGKQGTCSPVPAGERPPRAEDCKQSDVSTCGLDGTCDGVGECQSYPDGTVCTAGACSPTSASVTGIKKCSDGVCVAGGATICTPFACDSATNQCFGECTSDSQCAPGQTCKDGSCGKKPTGAACTAPTECESNFCVGNVCCGQACDGSCVTCSSVGSPGECVPVSAGRPDPKGLCKDGGAMSCKESGVCDGKGACAMYSAGTPCAAPLCLGNSAIAASTCNGSGACIQGSEVPCGFFKCASGLCPGTCASDTDCVAPNTCVNGSCGLKEAGQGCSQNSECRSNVCSADKVCCDRACDGACEACNLSQSLGKCSKVPAGRTDPRGICTERKKDANTCDENGLCDGNGGCQNYASGTQCAPAMCSAGKATPVSTCDGKGDCKTPAQLICSPNKCNGTKCGDTCANDSDCEAPNTCNAGSCGPKPNGSICSNPNQCQSGFCSQGVCCNENCEGAQCKACNLQGSRGTCSLVAAGTPDPAAKCKDVSSTSVCGTNGRCNANGSCTVGTQGTQCAAAVCASSTSVTPISTCDGAGMCATPAPQPCSNGLYTCASGVCKTSCQSTSDCAANHYCDTDAKCKPKKGLGETAASGDQCSSTFRVDGVCCSTASCAGPMCTGSSYTEAAKCNVSGKLGTCFAASTTCTGPGQCGNNNACKVYAKYDVSNYDDSNAVYGP